MSFRAFGPFKMERWSQSDVRELSECFDTACPGLKDASGVYVVVSETGGRLSPKYVGKTDTKFGGRFKTHFDRTLKKREQSSTEDAALFEQIFHSSEGGFSLYLIAESTPTGRFKKSRSNIRSKSIDLLEQELILTGFAKGHNLWNIRGKKLRRQDVPSSLNWHSETSILAKKELLEIFELKG